MKKNLSAPLRLRASALKTVHFAGLILAGGEGKRFGGPKAFAELGDGRTFLDACCAALLGAGASPVVATLPPETEDPQIDGLDALALPKPGMDMFGSLQTGLARLIEAAEWQKVAVLPVDHPLVHETTANVLAAADGRAVIPSYYGKHGHPICIDREVASAIIRNDFPGSTLREVLRSVGAVDVEVDAPGVIANCNTPAALSAALRAANSEL
jgi:CTP:molybdopterin cytidylyltransferase MocA